jgi:hypothetical protein
MNPHRVGTLVVPGLTPPTGIGQVRLTERALDRFVLEAAAGSAAAERKAAQIQRSAAWLDLAGLGARATWVLRRGGAPTAEIAAPAGA